MPQGTSRGKNLKAGYLVTFSFWLPWIAIGFVLDLLTGRHHSAIPGVHTPLLFVLLGVAIYGVILWKTRRWWSVNQS